MAASTGTQTTAADLGARVIYELPLFDLQGGVRTINIKSVAIDGCIRLVDCVAFALNNVLKIWEFPEPPLQEFKNFSSWPDFKYSAISYVWKGNPIDPHTTTSVNDSGFLVVDGAEDADPISVDVLRSACLASLQEDEVGRWRMVSRAEYIWLDRLCIVQTSKRDKAYQISQMYQLYACCTQCLIIAGGLGRLVCLDEETTWANRAWTLQECLAPHYPIVLFSWTRGTGRFIGVSAFKLREVGHGTGTALARFIDLVRACIDKPNVFNACPLHAPLSDLNKPSVIAAGTPLDIRIFGKGHADLFALRQTRLNFQNSSEPYHPASTRRCYSMVWRCALMRASSRPVDMVLSIMGLMGVSLNPADFNAHDRLKATLALASSIMNSGGSADWLGLPARIPPCPQMSTFPQFARTDVTGCVEYLVSDKWCPARSLDDWFFAESSWTSTEIWPWERLYGSVDENGYLIFTRKGCAVIRETATIADQEGKIGWPLLEAVDGTIWRFLEKVKHSPGTTPKNVAIPLWGFREHIMMNEVHVADAQFAIPAIKFMLVERHDTGKYHLVSYFYVHNEKEGPWKSRVESWYSYRFAIGGPEPLPRWHT
ncbi:hypothetical protein VM1G_02862 [Cytospora mali]|uniref:Heterokaryon incompatibility domain-containing protein n=1 Tax=Cytospora mali TaxID=578113 RepID=A0A194VVL9_CYTMA|nr:hypothetical protein VM1G_02862 [Valsa mali]